MKRGRRRFSSMCCWRLARLVFCVLLLAGMWPSLSEAVELFPGVVTFDPPSFLSSSPSLPGTVNTNSILEIRRYAAADNDPRTSQRLLIVSLRSVGTVLHSGKIAGYQPLNDAALRTEMLAAVSSTPNATNISPVTDTQVGGQPAWLVTYQVPRPYWRQPDGVLFSYEIYWVKVQSNRVVEIKLIADSPDHLQTLKSCIPNFKITKLDASTTPPP